MNDDENEELKRTHCNTVKKDKEGNEILKPKRVFDSQEEGIKACNWLNVQPDRTDKVITYQCTVCEKWHLGRNGKKLTHEYKKKLAKEIIKVKVVGQIDLSKFSKLNKHGRVDRNSKERNYGFK